MPVVWNGRRLYQHPTSRPKENVWTLDVKGIKMMCTTCSTNKTLFTLHILDCTKIIFYYIIKY